MKSISFPVKRVNSLRRAAERAREFPLEQAYPKLEQSRFDGWFASAFDANDLISVFDTLRLKPGFALHAYEFRQGPDGDGIIWAVPAGAPQLPSDDGPGRHSSLSDPPKPPGAVRLIQAIEGDGSPWSYLSASILRREAEEFGACWHGCDWTHQTILCMPPRQTDEPHVLAAERKLTGDPPVGNWTWRGPVPKTWEPTYAERESTRRVILNIHDPAAGEIYRATDTYRARGYDCTTRTSRRVGGGVTAPLPSRHVE